MTDRRHAVPTRTITKSAWFIIGMTSLVCSRAAAAADGPDIPPRRGYAEIVENRRPVIQREVSEKQFLAVSIAIGEDRALRYDIVIQGGRVIDPETGLDAVRNIGIRRGTISRISSEPLEGTKILDAHNLVAAPGFIDLHQHQQDPEAYRLKAFDGVTTALEMEIGVPDVTQFIRHREGHALINFGTTASYVAARVAALGTPMLPGEGLPPASPATNNPATQAQVEQVVNRLRKDLDAGGLGIGMGIQYVPGSTHWEVAEIFRLAAARGVPVFTHVRSAGKLEPGSSVESVEEVIAAAAETGASLHIAHINSSGLGDALDCLQLIAGARARGLDITTEAYPYGAGMTAINSALFNPGWREKFGIDYKDLELPDTGERLTKETFERLHGLANPMLVLVFLNPDEIVDAVIAHPLVMIASDGHKGHPRNAGTYARILARYVRSQQRLTLMDAIRKMALMPAIRLEAATPVGRKKGRLQEGADADVVIFDPQAISDRATYQSPSEPSVGVKYLLVGGTPVIEEGKIIPDIYPGRALTGKELPNNH